MIFDGLHKKTRHEKRLEKKIYQASSRINFLTEQQKRIDDSIAKTAAAQETIKEEVDRPVLSAVAQDESSQFERPRLKKLSVLKIVMVIILILLISGAMYLSEIVFSSNSSLNSFSKFNPLKQLARLITSPDKRVAGEIDDRVNILAMGMGGPGHDGPYLTDTIIVISIKPSTGEVGLISLPRDMIVQLNKNNWVKINSVYALNKAENETDAALVTSQIIEKTLNLPIHYYGVIDFKGFEEFIDNIGGIMVNVENGFVDNQYPTDDFKTTTVSFTAGTQLMDGQTALIFARSRHGTNFEGSDFARSRRQQLILQAVKEKVFKFSTLLSPQKLGSIYKLIDDSVETNLSIWQVIKIAKMVQNTDEDKIYRFVLDDSPESLLEPDFTEDGAWILKPKDGNFQAVQRLVDNIFNIGFIKEEAAKIEIQNGTLTPGLAYWTAVHLERLGYNIIKYENAQTNDYQKSIIYDITNAKKKKTIKWLKEELSAYVASEVPDYILNNYPQFDQNNLNASQPEDLPDLVVILGQNHAEIFKLPEEPPTAATATEAVATSTTETIEDIQVEQINP